MSACRKDEVGLCGDVSTGTLTHFCPVPATYCMIQTWVIRSVIFVNENENENEKDQQFVHENEN